MNLMRAMGLLVLLEATQVRAGNVYWTNINSSANWNNAGVWSATPTGGDTPTFTNQNNYTVNFPTGSGVVTTNFGALFDAGSLSASVFLNIGAGNTWLITNGNFRISGNAAAGSNNVNNVILTSGTLINTNPANQFAISLYGKGSLTVSNGATAIIGKAQIGVNTTAVGTLTVAGGIVSNVNAALGIGHSGTGAAWVLGGTLYSSAIINVGSQTSSSGSMTVSNGTVNASAGMSVGGGAAATAGARGALTVAGGLVQVASTLQVGRTSSTGTVFVTNGGVLEANTYSLGAHTANVVTNDGGVYQFTSATPTLTVASSGGISLNNGAISFRAINNADVNSALTGINFSGANTFMLNAASNTTGSAQAYTFDTGSRYANLALANGETAYRNGNVTIGAGGSFLAKDTKAAVTGVLTNSGAVTLLRSAVSFGNGLVINSGSTWQQDLGTNSSSAVVSGGLTLNGTATLNVTDAGGFAAQTYTVITYNVTALIAGGGTLTVGTIPGGFIGVIGTNTQGLVLLQVIPTNGAPVVQFSGNPTGGIEPLSVSFTDQSIGSPTSWAWDFGDGNTATTQSPSHSYTNGTYTVRLIACNGFGCTTNTRPAYIVVTVSNAPSAGFTAAPTNGVEPLPVIFTDTSTGAPTSWYWDFNNDGVIDATGQHPTNTFSAGTWTVSLIASNASGASAPATQTITVITAGSVDSDGDGLSDSDEINIYHTNPFLADTDGDGAGDWYEIFASFTDPNNAADKPNVPYPLPKPDSSTGVTNKPVKVFILMGQSNMAGLGDVDPINTNGTLATIVRLQNKFPNLVDTNGNWSVRKDVMYKGFYYVNATNLIVGLGETGAYIGPELGFGHVLGYYLDEPVLVIKSAMGGKSLGYNYLPPGSSRYTINGTNYAAYGDWAPSWPTNSSPPTSGTEYAGYWYDDSVSKAKSVLTNFNTLYPQYAAQGYQVAGFCWVQGEADSGSATIASIYSARYETNLVNYINQVRADFGVTNAPFVIATLGQNGTNMTGRPLAVCNAQLAVGDPAIHPEFAGTVKSMDTRQYWRSVAQSPSPDQSIHYYGNTETYMLIGDALGRGMIDLLQAGAADDYATWAAQWPSANLTDLNADYDGDGLNNDAERLFGLDPVNSASFNPISINSGLAAGTFAYTRRTPGLTGYSYTVETSTNLLSWTADVGAVQTAGVPAADVQTVLVTLSPSLLTGPKLFARMRASP